MVVKAVGVAVFEFVDNGKVAGLVGGGEAGGTAIGLVDEIGHVIGEGILVVAIVDDGEAVSPAIGVDEGVF